MNLNKNLSNLRKTFDTGRTNRTYNIERNRDMAQSTARDLTQRYRDVLAFRSLFFKISSVVLLALIVVAVSTVCEVIPSIYWYILFSIAYLWLMFAIFRMTQLEIRCKTATKSAPLEEFNALLSEFGSQKYVARLTALRRRVCNDLGPLSQEAQIALLKRAYRRYAIFEMAFIVVGLILLISWFITMSFAVRGGDTELIWQFIFGSLCIWTIAGTIVLLTLHKSCTKAFASATAEACSALATRYRKKGPMKDLLNLRNQLTDTTAPSPKSAK